jgi:hypothetical protein
LSRSSVRPACPQQQHLAGNRSRSKHGLSIGSP